MEPNGPSPKPPPASTYKAAPPNRLSAAGSAAPLRPTGRDPLGRPIRRHHDRQDAIKQELAAQAEQLDAANSALAADPERLRAEEGAKAADHERHLTELRETQQEADPWPTGIFDDAEAPASGSFFLGTNRWVGKGEGSYLVVHAGRSGSDDLTGRVLALWSDDNRIGYTLDLERVGALRILKADESVLVMVDSEGAEHRLDAVAGEWLD